MCAHIDEPSVPSHVVTALVAAIHFVIFLVTPSDSQMVIGASVSASIFHSGTLSSMAACGPQCGGLGPRLPTDGWPVPAGQFPLVLLG